MISFDSVYISVYTESNDWELREISGSITIFIEENLDLQVSHILRILDNSEAD